MDRRKITRELFDTWSDAEIDRPLDEFIEWLREEAVELGGEVSVHLEYERGYGYDGSRFTFELTRDESDDEMSARDAQERASQEAYAARNRASELEQLRRLKAKYGDA